MRATVDCVHCYLKQAVSCMTMAGLDEDSQHEILFKLMDFVKGFDRQATPAENSTYAVLKTYELMGVDDPYKEVKKQSNDLALELYPRLKQMLDEYEDRLYSALKIAVAGNVIDLGIRRSFDIEGELRYSMEAGFTKDHYDRFKQKLGKVNEILFLGDNAGEIVFDKVLVEELVRLGKKVTYVVKEGPVLNDSTMEDALYVGMDKVARVITTGSRFLGVSFKHMSQEFADALYKAPLIISKGQANFESLEQQEMARDRIFFLLKIKCDEVAKAAGAGLGDVVFFTK
ncbi:MAG: ARMT1-like domain-containing protein [Caldicoprobacter sp.]|uniref:damage-control phosphatase ARMT1 family protein n=1 Tax=Caldicoprobacter sp. TaxID=2004500 RepID=UPI0039C4A8A0